MTLVLRNADFTVNGVTFNAPKPSGHGGQTIYVNYKDDQNRQHKVCQIQTPWMYNPFGLTDTARFQKEGEQAKYFLELSFGNAPSAYMEDFHGKMNGLDQHIIAAGIEHQREWLNETEVDEEYIAQFYKPIVRRDRNKETNEPTGEYPDTIRFKIPHYINQEEDGTVTESFSDMQVYDGNRNRIEINSIEDLKAAVGKNNRIRAIVQFHSVWQTGQEFGSSWRVKRIQVLNNDGRGLGAECAFSTGSGDEGGGDQDESFEAGSDEE